MPLLDCSFCLVCFSVLCFNTTLIYRLTFFFLVLTHLRCIFFLAFPSVPAARFDSIRFDSVFDLDFSVVLSVCSCCLFFCQILKKARAHLSELMHYCRNCVSLLALVDDNMPAQQAALRDRADILVATPARLVAHLKAGNVELKDTVS